MKDQSIKKPMPIKGPINAIKTKEAHQKGISGSVRLGVVFTTSGEIVVEKIINGLPYGLTEAAVKAATQNRFSPAIKDGKPVNVRGNMEFYF